MAGSKDSRKRQARLSFTPVSSSSPAVEGYNQQIRDRAAKVVLEGSPSPAKRRKVTLDGSRGSAPARSLGHGSFLSSAASTQRAAPYSAESDSGSEPVRPTQRNGMRPRRSQQRKLDFSTARDPQTFDTPVKLSSSPHPRSSARGGIFGTQQSQRRNALDSSSEDSGGNLPSPRGLLDRRHRVKRGKAVDSASEVGKSSSSRNDILAENDSDPYDVITVDKGRTGSVRDKSEDEDEDDMPTTMGTRRRRRITRRQSLDSFISSSPQQASTSDDDLDIIGGSQNRQGTEPPGSDLENLPEVRAESATKPRRKLSRQQQQQHQEDLDDDLEFLGPSSDVEPTRTLRNTQSERKNARQQALAKLKRRRMGLRADVRNNDDSARHSGQHEVEHKEDKDSSDYDAADELLSGRQMFEGDEHDEDFIAEDDDDENLGVPDDYDANDIPIEFTRYASMRTKELFPYAVSWMVHKKINPGFHSNDELYRLTFRKLNDEVKGLAGSKFISSVWTEQFTYALNARPDITFEPLERDLSTGEYIQNHCDACNRTSHPATYQMRFLGKPYHRDSLEEVGKTDFDDDDDDDDSDADSGDSSSSDSGNSPDVDSDGHEIAPANRTFLVGRFCKGNAETAHALRHWRYHLNELVVTWLTRNGYSSAEELVKRDKWSTKKRRKYAEKILDRMKRESLIQTLWREFRGKIDEARTTKSDQERW